MKAELQIATDRAMMTPVDGGLDILSVGSITGKWSNKSLPQVGDRVKVTINGLGNGTVIGFFLEAEYVGVKVALEDRPEWHRKQNPNRDYCLVFGGRPAGQIAGRNIKMTGARAGIGAGRKEIGR